MQMTQLNQIFYSEETYEKDLQVFQVRNYEHYIIDSVS